MPSPTSANSSGIGVAEVYRQIQAWHQHYGERWALSPLLHRLAETGTPLARSQTQRVNNCKLSSLLAPAVPAEDRQEVFLSRLKVASASSARNIAACSPEKSDRHLPAPSRR